MPNKERPNIFRSPTYLPTKWFAVMVSVSFTVIGTAYVAGKNENKIEATLSSRLIADERRIDQIDRELEFRAQLRVEMMNKLSKLDAIEHRLSMIEGKLEGVRQELHR